MPPNHRATPRTNHPPYQPPAVPTTVPATIGESDWFMTNPYPPTHTHTHTPTHPHTRNRHAPLVHHVYNTTKLPHCRLKITLQPICGAPYRPWRAPSSPFGAIPSGSLFDTADAMLRLHS